jgi:hypothetical protein
MPLAVRLSDLLGRIWAFEAYFIGPVWASVLPAACLVEAPSACVDACR